METNELTRRIIAAAITVHRALGPGLLEHVYQECLARELQLCRINFQRQKPVPLEYKAIKLDFGYRLDLLVEDLVVVEVKAVEQLLAVHHAQLLTYMKLGGWKVGLLLNFHVPLLRQGIKRLVLNFDEGSSTAESQRAQR